MAKKMNLFSLQHSLRRITIARRIAIWVFMICLLPLILIGVYGYLHAESALRRNADEYNRKVVDALRSNIELTTDTFLTTLAELASNATIREGLKQFGALTPQEKFMVNKTISADVKSKFHRITDVYDIRIVSLENEPVYTTGYLYLMDEYADEAFSKITSSRENILWPAGAHLPVAGRLRHHRAGGAVRDHLRGGRRELCGVHPRG